MARRRIRFVTFVFILAGGNTMAIEVRAIHPTLLGAASTRIKAILGEAIDAESAGETAR